MAAASMPQQRTLEACSRAGCVIRVRSFKFQKGRKMALFLFVATLVFLALMIGFCLGIAVSQWASDEHDFNTFKSLK
jgi:hypothetical protein